MSEGNMRAATYDMLAIVALSAIGCGELQHTIVYDGATFSGPASGDYYRLSIGELPALSKIQHSAFATVYVRLDDGTIWELAQVSEAEAKARAPHPTDVNGVISYELYPQHVQLFYRGGRLTGAVLWEGTQFAKRKEGPFVKLPLSAAQVRAAFGTPDQESSFRAPMKWN